VNPRGRPKVKRAVRACKRGKDVGGVTATSLMT
jgi:hypothetical protein